MSPRNATVDIHVTRGRLVAIAVVVLLLASGIFIVLRPSDEGAPIPPELQAGAAIYSRHHCQQCHGARGLGSADLRNVNRDLATDEALASWLHHASRTKPGTRMPDYDGIIPEPDFQPLMRFVRWLGAANAPKNFDADASDRAPHD